MLESQLIYDTKQQERINKLLVDLGITPKNIGVYINAFIHRSIVNERADIAPEHNERLEFLGDAVLELVVTDKLFQDFPKENEGYLTDLRSALVRGRNLAQVAKKLGFSKYMFLGKGEEQSGGRENNYLLANTLEAFIGAIYLDAGLTKAREFILVNLYPTLDNIISNNLFKDFKTLFQEFSQAKYELTPSYQVLSESGPDHEKNYEIGVYLGEKLIAKGEGSSKKKGQEKAAENAYLQLKDL